MDGTRTLHDHVGLLTWLGAGVVLGIAVMLSTRDETLTWFTGAGLWQRLS